MYAFHFSFPPPTRAEFELFRNTPNTRFKIIQGTQPLLIQAYTLIRDLPQNERRESQAELDRIYYPLKTQSIRVWVSSLVFVFENARVRVFHSST